MDIEKTITAMTVIGDRPPKEGAKLGSISTVADREAQERKSRIEEAEEKRRLEKLEVEDYPNYLKEKLHGNSNSNK